MSTVTIVRGLPGSGKSTYAKSLGCFHVEADMYHQRDGEYQFDRDNITYAHTWCLKMAKEAIMEGIDVVISNTFVTNEQMLPYAESAHKFDCILNVVECKVNYGSIHGVPVEVLDRMDKQWEECDIIAHSIKVLNNNDKFKSTSDQAALKELDAMINDSIDNVKDVSLRDKLSH